MNLPLGCRSSGKRIAPVRFSPSINPRLSDLQLRGLGSATEKRKLQQYQKNHKKKTKDQHWKDLRRKMEFYRPTIAQQPIRNSELEEDMMSMEAKMDCIKKKEANKFKLFSSFRPKPAETEEINKYLASVAKKKIKSSIFCKGRSKALDSFLHQFARLDDVQQWEKGDEPTVSCVNVNNATSVRNDQGKSIVGKHKSSGLRYIDFSGVIRSLRPRAKTRKKQPKDKTVKTKLGSPSDNLWSPSEHSSVENYDTFDSIDSNLRPQLPVLLIGLAASISKPIKDILNIEESVGR